MTDEQQMTEEEPGTVAEVTPDETMEGNPEAGVLEKANDKETSQPKAVVFQILETTLDVSETNEVTSEPEMIEVESKLDETMEVKPESVDLTTEPEMNEAELDAVANFMPDETMEGIPESVEMTDEQQMTEEEPGTVAEVIPDETMEAKPDTGVLEDATDTETSEPEAVVFQNLETTLDVAETEEVTFEPEMIEAESVDMTAEVEITEAEPDAGKKTKMRRFGDKMKTILKLKSSKLDLLSNAQKTNYRILPPLRKVHQTPRIRVVRFYTETTLLLCRIGVDCASFDFAQNNSMDHDKELDTLEEVLADTGKK